MARINSAAANTKLCHTALTSVRCACVLPRLSNAVIGRRFSFILAGLNWLLNVMKDGEGKRKIDYETREFKSKGPCMFFRTVCAMRGRAAVGVAVLTGATTHRRYGNRSWLLVNKNRVEDKSLTLILLDCGQVPYFQLKLWVVPCDDEIELYWSFLTLSLNPLKLPRLYTLLIRLQLEFCDEVYQHYKKGILGSIKFYLYQEYSQNWLTWVLYIHVNKDLSVLDISQWRL